MSYAQAKSVSASSIPVIDMGPLRDKSDPRRVARQLCRASQDLGFIYVKNHGIAESLISETRASAMEFFRLEDDEKQVVSKTTKHRGYIKIGAAKMQGDARSDYKESFIFGDDSPEVSISDHLLSGSNIWPRRPVSFSQLANDYFEAVQNVAVCLMRGFAIGLDLDEEFFLQSNDKPLSRASFTYYPPQSEAMGSSQFGVSPHTDFGVLTVLCQDNVGGLQVQGLDGQWFAVPPIEGTLVVNVGDLLARWTHNQYHSTQHRVINSSGKERLSLVLAYDPNPETVIDPRQVITSDVASEVDFPEPITCGDYLNWRFNKSFNYANDSLKK